jgi:hypothetical protein
MGKTETIKQRAIYVYLPTHEVVKRWKDLAKAAGTSISKFVAEHVENSLMQEEESDYKARSSLIDEIMKLTETLGEKEKRIRHLDLLVEKLEEDLRLYRAQRFTEESFLGVKQYDRKLIEIVREPGSQSSEKILSRLGVKPREQEAVKAISVQLENLERYGLVRSTSKGWIWQE